MLVKSKRLTHTVQTNQIRESTVGCWFASEANLNLETEDAAVFKAIIFKLLTKLTINIIIIMLIINY